LRHIASSCSTQASDSGPATNVGCGVGLVSKPLQLSKSKVYGQTRSSQTNDLLLPDTNNSQNKDSGCKRYHSNWYNPFQRWGVTRSAITAPGAIACPQAAEMPGARSKRAAATPWVFIPRATTASVAPPITARQSRKLSTPAHWVGPALAITAQRAGEEAPRQKLDLHQQDPSLSA
jgi:hypothetical protein